MVVSQRLHPHGKRRWSLSTTGVLSLVATGLFLSPGLAAGAPAAEPSASSPSGWQTITAGGYHSCGIAADGSLWCWGANTFGQLGLGYRGDEPPVLAPANVEPGTFWMTIAAGNDHTCGIRIDHTLWCWGRNLRGQLGIGTHQSQSTPTQVGTDANWITVAGGHDHTCGVRNDGTLWCWGSDRWGSVGDGDPNVEKLSPVQIGTDLWLTVDTGYWTTCGLQVDHRLWCWGTNVDGEAGIGNPDKQRVTVPKRVGGATWLSVSVGYLHDCGIRTKVDHLWCWGTGLLGRGQHETAYAPVRIGPESWRTVDAGGGHNCGVKADGTLWCWGTNDHGQVGVGDLVNRPVPTEVSAMMTWKVLALGSAHSCAVQLTGFAYCWGSNEHGQVGDGTQIDRLAPTII